VPWRELFRALRPHCGGLPLMALGRITDPAEAEAWLASGEAPEWIARQLGHANTQMLFTVYSRFVPNLTRRDGSAIDRLLATRFASGSVDAAASDPRQQVHAPPANAQPKAVPQRTVKPRVHLPKTSTEGGTHHDQAK
jgi:hypothetical protein